MYSIENGSISEIAKYDRLCFSLDMIRNAGRKNVMVVAAVLAVDTGEARIAIPATCVD